MGMSVLAFFKGKFPICSWNARALCHSKRSLARAKALEVLSLTRKCMVVALCEVHGNEESLRVLLRTALRTHELVFHSGHANAKGDERGDVAGLALLVARELLQGQLPPTTNEIAPGRLGRVSLNFGGHQCRVYPCHNFGVSGQQMSLFESFYSEDLEAARRDPNRFSVILLGDGQAFAKQSQKDYPKYRKRQRPQNQLGHAK